MLIGVFGLVGLKDMRDAQGKEWWLNVVTLLFITFVIWYI